MLAQEYRSHACSATLMVEFKKKNLYRLLKKKKKIFQRVIRIRNV